MVHRREIHKPWGGGGGDQASNENPGSNGRVGQAWESQMQSTIEGDGPWASTKWVR